MKCLKEYELEKIIMRITQLSIEVREHLFRCDRCRERYTMLSQIYQESLSHKRTKSIYLNKYILKPQHISLHPINQIHSRDEYLYRLAAKEEQPIEKYTVYSFSNEKEGIVCRVMQDRQSNDVSLFLIADDMEQVKGRKVRLIDSNLEGITDHQGHVKFGKQSDFKCSNVQIHSPLAVFDLTPHVIKFIKQDNDILFY